MKAGPFLQHSGPSGGAVWGRSCSSMHYSRGLNAAVRAQWGGGGSIRL